MTEATIPTEVRYERLRPHQFRARREAFPALYIPLGTIEWHGRHNPVGLDTLKIHQLAIRCAEATGGLVFPPLYYGENRDEGLIESGPLGPDAVRECGLDPENFAPGHVGRSSAEQYAAYQQLLLHILYEAKSLGFRVIVLATGHYPLYNQARAAAVQFHEQCLEEAHRRPGPLPIPWVFTGFELVQDVWPDAGDHAGFWETSLLMELEPDLSDLSTQPSDPNEPLIGVVSKRPLQEANRAYGKEAVALIVERVAHQVRERMAHPERYVGHGLSF